MWKSHKLMLSMWIGVAVMGAVYLLGIWDGVEHPAFIVGQIVLGCIGAARELHLNKHGFS
ncbi:hypothetical protein M2404_004067 [Rheinheimera pacifica]|uniref:hypothetical protein n=1 Tax=Rheinheimera pacifica TaxID=173990 RepID=UPI00216788DA|nr:hypothetical protein [Rheinheimera pacifica]MCS4309690.1 hypothetical protein [Rheinheimera pacifica]